MDPIGAKVIGLFKGPTKPGDPVTGLNNFTAKLVDVNPSYQMDSKVDYYLNSANRLAVRYSFSRKTDTTPDPFLGSSVSKYNTQGGSIGHLDAIFHFRLDSIEFWNHAFCQSTERAKERRSTHHRFSQGTHPESLVRAEQLPEHRLRQRLSESGFRYLLHQYSGDRHAMGLLLYCYQSAGKPQPEIRR